LKKTIYVIFYICALLPASGCSTFRAISLVKGGEALNKAKEEREVPFELRGHLILVKGKINGADRDYTFILDTAALTVVGEEAAKELGLAKEVEIEAKDNAGGAKKAYLTRLKNLSLGDFTVNEPAAVIFDMAKIRRMEGINVDGIIGSNFLRFFKVKIDYQRRFVTLSGDTGHLSPVPGGYLVRFEQSMKQGFAPLVEVASSDATFDAAIDTGLADALSLPVTLLEKVDKDGMIEGKGVMGGGAFEENGKARLARLAGFRIGSSEFGRIMASAAEGQKLALIGKEFLSRFVVTLNYPVGEMLLIPIDGEKTRDNIFTAGMGIMRDEAGKTLVSGVWRGSPADRLGIVAKDEIAAINGKAAGGYPLTELRDMLKNDDGMETIELLIRNSDGEKRLTIRKEYLFKKE